MQIAHSALSTVGIAGRRVVATGRPDGSSPHVRGTPLSRFDLSQFLRFIPAYAGNAGPVTVLAWPPTVHPRMRGERGSFPLMSISACGSSPHARGTRVHMRDILGDNRFIPACAGNAKKDLLGMPILSVHPRMRGERGVPLARIRSRNGSSPHARGTRQRLGVSVQKSRFIPACAGNASTSGLRALQRPVHPRMRGERPTKTRYAMGIDGSSPHARGTLKSG